MDGKLNFENTLKKSEFGYYRDDKYGKDVFNFYIVENQL